MTTSAYFMDLNPQYRDNGCPSQCMGMNEYTTVPNMYTFDTDPKTPLLAAGPMNPYGGVNSTMPRVATQPPPQVVQPQVVQPQVVQPQVVQPQVVQPTVQPNGDLFANVANVDPNALTNLNTNFAYVDPDMNYRMKYGATSYAPNGLVFPVSGSIKNRVSSRYESPILKEARQPDMVSTSFGYDYPVMMNKPQAGYGMQTVAPIRITYPRA